MAQIIWTTPALSDLNEIADYIALENHAAAQQLVQTVFSNVEHLEQFPDSGRIPPELEHTFYREIIVGPCRVFILYVMRVERKPRKFLIDNRTELL